jgi:glutathione-independent formaldehyde dehydrogenase
MSGHALQPRPDDGHPVRPDAYLTPLLTTEVIPLDSAVEAYKIFGEGSPKKFVIDPHNTTKLASAGKTSERTRGHASAHHR